MTDPSDDGIALGYNAPEVGHHGEGDRREGADEGPALAALERREQPGEQADRGEHRTGPTDRRGVFGVDQEEQDNRASPAATTPVLTERARASCRMSPSVFSATKIARG